MAKHFRENKGRSPPPFNPCEKHSRTIPFPPPCAHLAGFAKRAKMILMFLCSARTSCLQRWKPPSEVVHPENSLFLSLSLSPFSSLNFRAVFMFARVEDRESDVVRETSCRCLSPITSRFFASSPQSLLCPFLSRENACSVKRFLLSISLSLPFTTLALIHAASAILSNHPKCG